ncbi:hypothetical protein FRB93_007454 [Tulasnella sp. JGI-2019a]|nr:hypothetical protein FRB93_007454 [Tulasnella sp. JGI-2019a]
MYSSFSFPLLLISFFSPLALTVGDRSDIGKYRYAHSYGADHHFSESDGWQQITVSDAPYKYASTATEPSFLVKRGDGKHPKHHKIEGPARLHHHSGETWGGMKSHGGQAEVLITWYTGHDLTNPSCWANIDWAPTDESFVAALTLHGWKTKPQCFEFIELCNGPRRCALVRVVDTCAGCAAGSAHVDLTKAPFSQLASLETGQIKVHMPPAMNRPDKWYKELWGPDMHGTQHHG